MNKPSSKTPENNSEIIIYQTEEGRSQIQVRLENETVWLTQNLIAELYRTTKQNISLHIQNIYEEGELLPEATVKEYLTVRSEGKRTIKRPPAGLRRISIRHARTSTGTSISPPCRGCCERPAWSTCGTR
jgi:hypothetical protein